MKNNLCFFIKTNIKLYVWYFKINISSSTRLVMFRNWNDTSATQRLTTQVLNLLLHSQLQRWMENTYKDSFVRMLLLLISWLYSFLNRLTTMYIFFKNWCNRRFTYIYFYNYLFLPFFFIHIRVPTRICFLQISRTFISLFLDSRAWLLRTTVYLAQNVRAWCSQYTRWINGKN